MAIYDDNLGEVKAFPYRKAMVSGPIFSLPRDACVSLERYLAEKAGTRPDNHTVYEAKQNGDEEPIYIGFSDSTVTFARKVREYPNGY